MADINTKEKVDNSENSQALPYVLPRNSSELVRLTAQYYLASMKIGYLLNPIIAKYIETIDTPQIADVACGPGLWALEIAEKYPNTSITGLDICDKMFPQTWQRPHNVEFDTLDLLEASTSAEYQAKFDVVHMRLILASAPLAAPEAWLRNLQALLKPGGYLQWEDTAYSGVSVVSFAPEDDPIPHNQYPFETAEGRRYSLSDWAGSPALFEIVKAKEKTTWFADFPRIASSIGGFAELGEHDTQPAVKSNLLHLEGETGFGAFLSAIEMLVNSNGLVDEESRQKLLDDKHFLEQALRDKLPVTYNFLVRIARRAMSSGSGA